MSTWVDIIILIMKFINVDVIGEIKTNINNFYFEFIPLAKNINLCDIPNNKNEKIKFIDLWNIYKLNEDIGVFYNKFQTIKQNEYEIYDYDPLFENIDVDKMSKFSNVEYYSDLNELYIKEIRDYFFEKIEIYYKFKIYSDSIHIDLYYEDNFVCCWKRGIISRETNRIVLLDISYNNSLIKQKYIYVKRYNIYVLYEYITEENNVTINKRQSLLEANNFSFNEKFCLI